MGIQKQLWIEQFSIFPHQHNLMAQPHLPWFMNKRWYEDGRQSYHGAVDAVNDMAGLVEHHGQFK